MAKERRFVNQLMPGETIDQIFLVRDRDLRTASNGQLYVTCTLCDRTGHVSARMWQATESVYSSFTVDGFLHVKGRSESYRGMLQLVIDACRPVATEKVDLADFLPTTPHDIDAMWAELLEILQAVKNPSLKLLVKKFCDDRPLMERFRKAPAALQLHHAYIGGLLEHTLGVARLAKAVLPLYPQVNPDLVLTGVFLHDIGKAAELGGGTAISYTERGQLVGHITIAAIWAAEKAKAVGDESGEAFPPRTLDLVQHIILSHHGEYEFGSPKLPAIPEAFMLHHLDNLDAKMFITSNAITNDPDPNAPFTSYMRELETRLYKRSNKL